MSNSSERPTVYLDSNVFILPALYTGKKSDIARRILLSIVRGELKGVTSTLTIDEVVWAVLRKTKKRELAIGQGERLFRLANLLIVAVDPQSVLRALGLMRSNPNLKPRDAIHAGVCLNKGISKLYTDDPHFDAIPKLTRIPLVD